jgi:hypothetical protein
LTPIISTQNHTISGKMNNEVSLQGLEIFILQWHNVAFFLFADTESLISNKGCSCIYDMTECVLL